MSKFYLLPILAIVAVIFVIRTVIMGSMPPPIAAPVVQPAQAPYETFVAGSGIIEASSENISIASPLAGVIKEVFVKAGDKVSVNQPLFSLDDRAILAELLVNEAQVTKAKASLADAETQLSIYRGVKDERAITRGELLKRESALLLAQAGVAQADATVMASRTTIDRMTIRSPLNGEVLQLRARVGEFAPAQIMITPLMVLGTVYPLGVRVDIDENDAWRVESGRPGLATLRGNTALSFPLTFVRFEPYVVPKRSLTGESTERVDTRVLQVIYSFDRGTLPIYVGQLVDVFIESKS
ncbi:MAG: efflux RND transporter periplasmic adaptor subunit [Proteobacteria bacterium]|nr:efflux RND transporter periplasmic adaptor subunit [Pseudomonadota bacterium]